MVLTVCVYLQSLLRIGSEVMVLTDNDDYLRGQRPLSWSVVAFTITSDPQVYIFNILFTVCVYLQSLLRIGSEVMVLALRQRWYRSGQENKVFVMIFLLPGAKIIKNWLYNSRSSHPLQATFFFSKKRSFWIQKPYLSNCWAPYSLTARCKHFILATILCRIMCSLIIY